MQPDVTAISVLIKCEAFLPRFFENVRAFEGAERQELLLFVLPSDADRIDHMVANHLPGRMVRRVVVEQDPGLYGLWNQGVAMARGRHLTNLNPDDLRAPWHLRRCVEWLDSNPAFGLVCGQIAYSERLADRWREGLAPPSWLAPLKGEFFAENLFTLDPLSGQPVSSKNIPHCMPVWRASVHAKVGGFDEAAYGPSADWAFWLHAMGQGLRGWLIPEVMGIFHRNPQSYWQVHARGDDWDRRIIDRFRSALDSCTAGSRSQRLARANQFMAGGDVLLALHAYARLVDEDPCFGPGWTNLWWASRRAGDMRVLEKLRARHGQASPVGGDARG